MRLQAIIRGQVVRRQALTALKCLQSIVNIQSQVCARRFQMVEGSWQQHDENKELITLKDKILKVCLSIVSINNTQTVISRNNQSFWFQNITGRYQQSKKMGQL